MNKVFIFEYNSHEKSSWGCLGHPFQALNGQNDLNGQFPKWWTVLDISIPNDLKQCSPFSFQMVWNSAVNFHSIHFHSKCIINKQPFYPFLLFGMVKTILTKYLFHSFHPFLPFGMVKAILTIQIRMAKMARNGSSKQALYECLVKMVLTIPNGRNWWNW